MHWAQPMSPALGTAPDRDSARSMGGGWSSINRFPCEREAMRRASRPPRLAGDDQQAVNRQPDPSATKRHARAEGRLYSPTASCYRPTRALVATAGRGDRMLAPVLLLPRVLAIAEEAGAVILRHYREGTTVTTKADASPVTAADEAGEAIILARLRELTANLPNVAEEAVARGEVPDVGDGLFWLVDPLDGTKEFISGNGEFTVNVGLIDQRRPVLGVVLAPARGLAWWGASGQGASRREGDLVRPIAVRQRPQVGSIAVASRSHRDAATDAWLAEEKIVDTLSAGSSLKFCLIAEGKADVSPRFGPTMEWDTAAGDAVLRAAGGRVQTTDGAPFLYRKPGFRNPGFIARGA